MTQKLSPHKVSRMLQLYFEGYTQTQIANKLKVNQSTISLYVSKFKFLVNLYGLEDAGKELDIMDDIEALHSLSAELKQEKLTCEEAKAGIKMEKLFKELGVKHEDYPNLVKACKKMNTEGFLESAVKLDKLESSTCMTYEEVVAKFDKTNKDLLETQHDLQTTTGKLIATENELAKIYKQKKLVIADLKAHMKQAGVDMKRLTLVEGLAVALKEANITDEELSSYIQGQQVLNESGISLDIFVALVEKAEVLTSPDQGKELLNMLSEHVNLTGVLTALNAKKQLLENQIQDLEEKAKLKGQIEAGIVKLKTEKESLEACVSQLSIEKSTLAQLQDEVGSLIEKKAMLEKETAAMREHRTNLSDDIKFKEQKVSDLKNLELKHDAVSASLAEIEAKEANEGIRWQLFESFLGFVGSSSLEEVGKFADLIPYLLSEAKQRKYSPEELRNRILRGLTGETLQSFLCVSCSARFVVDKPPHSYKGYDCPICGLSHRVKVDQEGLAILKTALVTQKPQIVLVQSVTQKLKNPTPKDKNTD
jgi:predicted transcriptional regulator/DNA-directed RNA polymerase subunit RPC12/RpoP